MGYSGDPVKIKNQKWEERVSDLEIDAYDERRWIMGALTIIISI